jgi:hypothetical protein
MLDLFQNGVEYTYFRLLSRICGSIPVPGVVPSCDTRPFPWPCSTTGSQKDLSTRQHLREVF